MRDRIDAVVEELKRRRADGEKYVFVQPDSISGLREACQSAAGRESLPDETVQAVQPSVRAPESVSEPEPSAAVQPSRPFVLAPPAEPVRAPRRKASAAGSLPEPPVFELPEGDKRSRWEWLRNRVLDCPVCQANLNPGKQIVFGNGNIDSPIFFCGEAPGADEEDQGIPFVGRAGQLLIKIINAMGLAREDVYIGNIMNWRPQTGSSIGNRAPTPEEMAFCLPYLKAQVEVVAPKVIVALGNTALKGLLGQSAPGITRARGRWFDFNGTPLMPTYHPSYVMRYGSPKIKREIWEDMLAVMGKTGMPVSARQQAYFLPKE